MPNVNFNQVTIAGRMGRDPEMRFLPNGTAVVNLSLAVSRVYTDKEGQRQEETDWIRCEAWARTAEIINEYTKKGSTILVNGSLKTDSWEDPQSGEKRSKTYVRIQNMQLLDPKESNAESTSQRTSPQSRRQPAAPSRRPVASEEDAHDDQIPF